MSCGEEPCLGRSPERLRQYDWDGPGGKIEKQFTGNLEPEKLGEQGGGKRNTVWKYDNVLYPALMWYWSTVTWSKEEAGEISWAEVALDFQAATHTGLAREGREWSSEDLRTRAKIMAASSRRIAQICREDISPGGRKATNTWVGTLRGLGFGTVRGIQAKPVLMKRNFVQQVLLQEAVHAATNLKEATLNFVPDMSGVGEPQWEHGNDLSPKHGKKKKEDPTQKTPTKKQQEETAKPGKQQ